MSSPHPSASSLQIPRFIENLNSFAIARGLRVEIEVAPYDDHPETRLWSRWSGPRETFLATAILRPSQHLPLKRGWLTVPSCGSGEVVVTGDSVCWELDGGPAEYQIELRGEVEVVTYADQILYHGTPDALVAAGINRSRLPTGKRPAKQCYPYIEKRPAWKSRRQLDGKIVHRVESPKAFAARLREQSTWSALARRVQVESYEKRPRPNLRLVIDNTKEESHD